MQRIDDILKRLRELRRTLRRQRSIDTVEMAIYELENGFSPADGVWIVKRNGTELSKFAELPEVDNLDVQTLAKLENRRFAAAKALTAAIEDTKHEYKNETWWTVAPQEIIDKVFRAVIEGKEETF